MDVFQSAIVSKLIFILGVINLSTAILIFGSCRCIPGSKIFGRLMNYSPYNRFFKYHCYIWRVFWPSVIVHAFLAIMFFGWPG